MSKISDYYDRELKHFVDAMRYKLHVHRAKGKWGGTNLNKLFDLLVGEVEELREAASEGNQIAIILEAADIANYAMIIANVAMRIAAGENFEHEEVCLINAEINGLLRKQIDELNVNQAPHLNALSEEIKAAIIGGGNV